MRNTGILNKTLALTGAVLVWLPLLAPVLLSLGALFTDRQFLFDYLIPAELFPFVLVGGAVLFWAAWRADARRGLIGWSLLAAVVSLIGGQSIAVTTGLASGETEAAGLPWALVIASLLIYILAAVAIATGGLLLLRDLFRRKPSPA